MARVSISTHYPHFVLVVVVGGAGYKTRLSFSIHVCMNIVVTLFSSWIVGNDTNNNNNNVANININGKSGGAV